MQVKVNAKAVAKAALVVGANGIQFDVGAQAVVEGVVDACTAGGLICGTLAASKGPQIGVSIELGWTKIKLSPKLGIWGVALGVRVRPEVIRDTIVEGVDAYYKLTSGEYLPPGMQPLPKPRDDW
ncbi:hypothetical protein [Amycolatopsis sp. DG1A-15b]|uniref:hypothetical protein n=1 Tax=Amycolatopsis sp. DG1A-15b TaxID=3052846 RepID=UPI00255B959C|nr:hypothetical protein [Amycolatopsis sp. DG1A-15b]WIX85800.1 hypothetical protein QRY02_31935 [Amycolatopsis sp. DG1A-15b]